MVPKIKRMDKCEPLMKKASKNNEWDIYSKVEQMQRLLTAKTEVKVRCMNKEIQQLSQSALKPDKNHPHLNETQIL